MYGEFFYMFNPFNEEAPKYWKKMGRIYQKNKHPMTIFRRVKIDTTGLEGAGICEAILVDKVKHLSGYPLKVAEINQYINISNFAGKVQAKNIFSVSQKDMRLIWNELGATIDYQPITQEELGTLEPNGSSNGVVSEVLEGFYECRSDFDYSRGFWQHEVNTLLSTGICYITRKNLVPVMEQLKQVFPLMLRIEYSIIFGILTLIYIYLMKGDSAEVALDILRAMMGQSMSYRPKNQISSIMFSGLVFTFMTITLMLQCLLNAITTARLTDGKNIVKPDDLVIHNFHAYSDPYYSQYFGGTVLENKISPVTGVTECLEMLRKNASVACIDDCSVSLLSTQEDDELHVSMDKTVFRFDVFFFRHDSPLREKFQWISLIILQGGIPQYLEYAELNQYKKLPKAFSKITINQLRSAFYALFIGFQLSFAIFLVELLGGKIFYFSKNFCT